MERNYPARLGLGTVQFGTSYGVSNRIGQTSISQVRDILNFAYSEGIRVLDTAASYGDSEEVLGGTLGSKDWKIITKTPYFKEKTIENLQVIELRKTFQTSLRSLHRQHIESILIHSCDDLFKPGGEKLYKEVKKIKSSGRVGKIGVSVYNSAQIDRLLDNFEIDLVQLPINILDQRLIESGHLSKLKRNGVEIHARSVFLQGLLLMENGEVPSFFRPIFSQLDRVAKRAEENLLSRIELLLGFVLSNEEIEQVIVGVNNIIQLKEIIRASSKNKIPAENYGDLAIHDSKFLNPSCWPIK